MINLCINMLGWPEICRSMADGGETAVTNFASAKVQAILFYLAVTRQPVARERLIGLLWPDVPEKKARTSLRSALYNLQKQLPNALDVTRKTIMLAADCGIETDTAVFQTGLEADDLACIRRSVSLYAGDFLEGFHIDDAPEFEYWSLVQRERLRHQMLEALDRLINHDTAQGDTAVAIENLRRLLALEPWREAAHRQLMLLLARQGKFNAALKQYESCRQALADELDISPTQATTALADRISALQERPRHNLPPQPTPFVGRETELTQLAALLAAPENRLVTIVAAGGMGKTRLALAVAANQTGSFLDGVAFVPLAPVAAPALLATTMVETLGGDGFIEPQQGHKIAADYLLDALAEKELLLVLDNYEQLLPDISLLLTILEHAPQIKLLVTSRERLNMRWERPYPLTGLPYPSGNEQDGAMYSAPTLFLQMARQTDPDFHPTAADQQAISRICQLVEGMPLALELAATWARVQTPAAIAAEIGKNLDILHTRHHDWPARQRSMHAVFDQTWARLSSSERKGMAQLSVFRGPFTVTAVESVTGADWSLLAALVDKSLLRQKHFVADGETDPIEMAVYYEMHELLRQYALKQLQAQSAAEEAKRRHGQYYAQLLAAYEPQLQAGDQVTTTLKQMRREIDNIRAAWEWALSTRQGDSLNQMLGSVYRFYFLPSLVRDGLAVMAAAADQLSADQLSAVQDRDEALRLVYGRILARQGSFTWLLHEDYATAERLARRSLAILETETTGVEVAQALNNLANIIYTRDLPTAQMYWERSLHIYQQTHNLERQATLLRNLCVTAPDYATMLTYWEQALSVAVAGNDRRNEGHLYFIRGVREFHVGHLPIARELTPKSIDIIRTIDDPPHLILVLEALTAIFTAENQFDEARLLLQEMGKIAERLSIRWHSLLVRLADGRLAVAESRFEVAERELTYLLTAVSGEGSYKSLRQIAYFHRGRLRFKQGDMSAAREQWQHCWDTVHATDLLSNSYRWRARVGIGETWLYEGGGETAASQAVPHLQQAGDLARAIGADAAWQQERTRLTETYQESGK